MWVVTASLRVPRCGHSLCVDLCGWIDTGVPEAQVCLLLQPPQHHLADSMPRPCVMSASCPLWTCPELPPSSRTDLRVYSRLWVHDQRESQQHHDHPAGAHPAAEQVPSKSAHRRPCPSCWWFAVSLGEGAGESHGSWLEG